MIRGSWCIHSSVEGNKGGRSRGVRIGKLEESIFFFFLRQGVERKQGLTERKLENLIKD